jgi:hypothetical protein
MAQSGDFLPSAVGIKLIIFCLDLLLVLFFKAIVSLV